MLWYSLVIIFSLLVNSCVSKKSEPTDPIFPNTPCDHYGNCSVKVPFYYDDPSNTEYLDLKFKVYKGDTTKAAIVYLNGGPGGNVDPKDKFRDNISIKRTLIIFNPRGVNDNKVHQSIRQTDFYTTKNLARDAIKVISAMHFDNYILYGSSYGTLLGTVITDLIRQTKELALPRNLVIEGVLGRAFKAGEVYQDYVKQWNDLRNGLNSETQNFLKQDYPYGNSISREDLGVFIDAFLGYSPGVLKKFLELRNPVHKDLIRDVVMKSGNLEQTSIFKSIACQEIIREFYSFSLDKNLGLHVNVDHGFCDQIKIRDSFDAANYDLAVPVYYLQGELDPATAVWQANYHKTNVKAQKKSFHLFHNASHSVTNNELENCLEKMWDAIDQNKSINTAVNACVSQTQLHLHGKPMNLESEMQRALEAIKLNSHPL